MGNVHAIETFIRKRERSTIAIYERPLDTRVRWLHPLFVTTRRSRASQSPFAKMRAIVRSIISTQDNICKKQSVPCSIDVPMRISPFHTHKYVRWLHSIFVTKRRSRASQSPFPKCEPPYAIWWARKTISAKSRACNHLPLLNRCYDDFIVPYAQHWWWRASILRKSMVSRDARPFCS